MQSPQFQKRAPAPRAEPAVEPRASCCVCGHAPIPVHVRLVATFGARTRCRRCGSVLRAARAVRWARLPFDAVAIAGALWLMAHATRADALLLFVAISALPGILGVYRPLEADARDPITRRALERSRRAKGAEPLD